MCAGSAGAENGQEPILRHQSGITFHFLQKLEEEYLNKIFFL